MDGRRLTISPLRAGNPALARGTPLYETLRKRIVYFDFRSSCRLFLLQYNPYLLNVLLHLLE
jgi:hypothetical protein